MTRRRQERAGRKPRTEPPAPRKVVVEHDEALIDHLLSLTVEERLDCLTRLASSLLELRRATGV